METIITPKILTEMILNASPEKRIHIVGRALVGLFQRQTEDERANNSVAHDNGRGFMSCDSIGGSLTAKSYIKRRTLQDWQVEKWTRLGSNGLPILAKYARQLNEISNEKKLARSAA